MLFDVVEFSLPQLVAVELGLDAQEPLGQFQPRLLQAEQQYAVLRGRNGEGEVADERGLPHARPGREDDQLRRLEPAGDVVESVEAGRNTADGPFLVHAVEDPLERQGQNVPDGDAVETGLVLGDVVDPLLGPGDDLLRLITAVVRFAE